LVSPLLLATLTPLGYNKNMKYFSKILKTLKEKISGKKLSGLHITPSEDFYFIEIKKIKKSWSPIF
jgi:hypothetical protein